MSGFCARCSISKTYNQRWPSSMAGFVFIHQPLSIDGIGILFFLRTFNLTFNKFNRHRYIFLTINLNHRSRQIYNISYNYNSIICVHPMEPTCGNEHVKTPIIEIPYTGVCRYFQLTCVVSPEHPSLVPKAGQKMARVSGMR